MKSGEKGRRKVTAGHAGEKESEQIRRDGKRWSRMKEARPLAH